MNSLAAAGVLGICALAIVMPAGAQPQSQRGKPLDLRTNTDYPMQGQPLTLTSYWEGIRPPYSPRYQVRYQVSRTNPPSWQDVGTPCTAEPCQLQVASPAAGEFSGKPNGVVVYVRAVVHDTRTRTDKPAQTIKTVTWLPNPNQPATPAAGGYFLSIAVNGQPGCTIRPRPKDDSYANSTCRLRATTYDVHQAGIPVVRLGADGRGRFTSAAFTIVATWGPLPPGQWSVAVQTGNFRQVCTTSPCTLNVPNQSFDGNFIGRASMTASLTWKEGTRNNPSTEGWPSGLGAEVGIDYMRQ